MFGRNKAIGRYFGLVPKQDASGGVNRMGRITKEGPAIVRKMLVEAPWQGTRRSPTIRAYHERMKHDRDDRNKKALVATAHDLARVMLAMLPLLCGGCCLSYSCVTIPVAAKWQTYFVYTVSLIWVLHDS